MKKQKRSLRTTCTIKFRPPVADLDQFFVTLANEAGYLNNLDECQFQEYTNHPVKYCHPFRTEQKVAMTYGGKNHLLRVIERALKQEGVKENANIGNQHLRPAEIISHRSYFAEDRLISLEPLKDGKEPIMASLYNILEEDDEGDVYVYRRGWCFAGEKQDALSHLGYVKREVFSDEPCDDWYVEDGDCDFSRELVWCDKQVPVLRAQYLNAFQLVCYDGKIYSVMITTEYIFPDQRKVPQKEFEWFLTGGFDSSGGAHFKRHEIGGEFRLSVIQGDVREHIADHSNHQLETLAEQVNPVLGKALLAEVVVTKDQRTFGLEQAARMRQWVLGANLVRFYPEEPYYGRDEYEEDIHYSDLLGMYVFSFNGEWRVVWLHRSSLTENQGSTLFTIAISAYSAEMLDDFVACSQAGKMYRFGLGKTWKYSGSFKSNFWVKIGSFLADYGSTTYLRIRENQESGYGMNVFDYLCSLRRK